MNRIFAWQALATILAFTAGCGDNKADEPPGAPASVSGGSYVTSSWVFTPDGTASNSYLTVVDELSADSPIAFDESIEVAGAANIWAAEDAVLVGGGESPTLTRYVLEGGRLAERETISFADYGAQWRAAQHDHDHQ